MRLRFCQMMVLAVYLIAVFLCFLSHPTRTHDKPLYGLMPLDARFLLSSFPL